MDRQHALEFFCYQPHHSRHQPLRRTCKQYHLTRPQPSHTRSNPPPGQRATVWTHLFINISLFFLPPQSWACLMQKETKKSMAPWCHDWLRPFINAIIYFKGVHECFAFGRLPTLCISSKTHQDQYAGCCNAIKPWVPCIQNSCKA